VTWFKVDDKFHSHRKVTGLGKDVDALALWVVAGSWAADQLTDGFVPESVVFRLLPVSKARAKRMALALESARLWERVEFNPASVCAQSASGLDPDCAQTDSKTESESEPGWRFHGWNERGRQPTSSQVIADREANAARVTEHRARKEAARNAITNGVTNGVGNRTPARPDPSSLPTEEMQQRASAREGISPIPVGAIPLIDALTAEGLVVSWDLTPIQWAQVRAAVERSGIPALVEHSKRRHHAAPSPANSARAWLRDWSTLPALNAGAPLAPPRPSVIGAPSEAGIAQPRPFAEMRHEFGPSQYSDPGQFDFGDTNRIPE